MQDTTSERTGTADKWVWLSIGAVAGLLVGFLVSGGVTPQPSDPALSVARTLGVAIPAEQLGAFSDGQISEEEVEEAAQEWRDCAIEAGDETFFLELRPDGYSSSYDSDGTAVRECEVRYFKATYTVFSFERLQGDDE